MALPIFSGNTPVIPCLLALTTLGSCSLEDSNHQAESQGINKPQSAERLNVPDTLLSLDRSVSGPAALPGEDLFGRFFCDRAEFYIIRDPGNLVHGVRAESITLYYLDGKLGQARYTITEDISEVLIMKLGRFSIVGLDPSNREVLASGRSLQRTASGYRLNPDLDNVELRWNMSTQQIRYRMARVGEGFEFTYTERISGYELAFREVEKHCI